MNVCVYVCKNIVLLLNVQLDDTLNTKMFVYIDLRLDSRGGLSVYYARWLTKSSLPHHTHMCDEGPGTRDSLPNKPVSYQTSAQKHL